jgi:hypothetical protein
LTNFIFKYSVTEAQGPEPSDEENSTESQNILTQEDITGDLSESAETDIESDSEHRSIYEAEELHLLLHEHTNLTKGDFVLDILKFYRKNSVSKKCLGRLLELFHKYLPVDNIVPSTLYKFRKIVKNCTGEALRPERQKFCNSCHLLLEVNQEVCPRCDSKKFVHCISNSVKDNLKMFFEQRGLKQAIDEYKIKCSDKVDKDIFFDFESGNISNSLDQNSTYDLKLVMNTDGFPATRGSTPQQVWPIFLSIANVAPNLRKEYMIIAKIWYSESKPKMSELLDSWVEQMDNLNKEGFVWKCPETQNEIISKVSVIAAVTDSHARAPIQNISLYNGQHGCSFCEIPGLGLGIKRLKRVYPFEMSECPLRTPKRMLLQAEELVAKRKEQEQALKVRKRGDPKINTIDKVVGVKGISSLFFLPGFNVADSFSPDYLHSVLLGTTKRHLLLITDSKNKNKDFYIGKVSIEVSRILENIKPPAFVTRLPRGLHTVKTWKGSEFLYWLLFYSLPCLKDAFKKKEYLEHWSLLVEGIHILCREEISKEEVQKANSLLRNFCRDYNRLYGESEETFNLHLLLHFANSVVNLGPLWATSTFIFEGANGLLKSKIHGNANIAMELSNTFQMINAINNFESMLNKNLDFQSSDKITLLGKAKNCMPFLPEVQVNDDPNFQDNSQFYLRARKNGILYTSELYTRALKTCSHFVKYSTGTAKETAVAKIIFFVSADNSKNFFGKKIKVKDIAAFGSTKYESEVKHIREYQETNDFFVAKIESIIMPLFKVHQYLCEPANMYEINL